uniref:Uncharacterized protein n=1 Tax=Lutzomyia longipalpis TaxID=7200 RepID=A0A1B0CE57_LUTLO
MGKEIIKKVKYTKGRKEGFQGDCRESKGSNGENSNLRHKVKRETKSALREIRRDAEFIGKMRIKRQMQLDRERREKVKRIFAEASDQQAELNALDRSNKRRKR